MLNLQKIIEEQIEALRKTSQQFDNTLSIELDKESDAISKANAEQLFDGIRSDSTATDSPPGRPYARSTIRRKRAKGQPFDRVTLKDRGVFHKSIDARVSIQTKDITISSPVPYQKYLVGSYGKKIYGLTDSNLSKLARRISPRVSEGLVRKFRES